MERSELQVNMNNNPMQKQLSIIIVNYNSGDYLLHCVKSVLSKTNLNLEIFVVDNASVDNSITLLRTEINADPRISIIENHNNLGFSKANNVALPKTLGKYLLFLNPDCIIKAGTLERMLKVMETNPKAGMAGCLIRNEDNTVQATCVRSIPTPWNSLVRILHLNKLFPKLKIFHGLDLGKVALPSQITDVPAISGAFMWIRRTALEQVGPLDESYFLYGEDVDWMWRFKQAGWQILFVPDVEITHAKGVCGRRNPFKVLWHKHRAMILFYRKFFSKRYPMVLRGMIYTMIVLRFTSLFIIALCLSIKANQ